MPSACSPAQTPTMSTIESIAPTSWKWTSSTAVPWTVASACGERAERAQRHLGDRLGQVGGAEHRADVGPGARVRLPLGDVTRTPSALDAARADALDDDARLRRERGGDRRAGPRR